MGRSPPAGVPPRQVDGEGQEIVEIGSHQRGILEELEKAHIYIEQLHRRIEDRDRQIGDLTAKFAALEVVVNGMRGGTEFTSR